MSSRRMMWWYWLIIKKKKKAIKKLNAFPGHWEDEVLPNTWSDFESIFPAVSLAFCCIPLTLFLILNTEDLINHCFSCSWNQSSSKHLHLLNVIRSQWWSSCACIFNPLLITKQHNIEPSLHSSSLPSKASDIVPKHNDGRRKGLTFHISLV